MSTTGYEMPTIHNCVGLASIQGFHACQPNQCRSASMFWRRSLRTYLIAWILNCSTRIWMSFSRNSSTRAVVLSIAKSLLINLQARPSDCQRVQQMIETLWSTRRMVCRANIENENVHATSDCLTNVPGAWEIHQAMQRSGPLHLQIDIVVPNVNNVAKP